VAVIANLPFHILARGKPAPESLGGERGDCFERAGFFEQVRCTGHANAISSARPRIAAAV
jgi:hypothetical protein